MLAPPFAALSRHHRPAPLPVAYENHAVSRRSIQFRVTQILNCWSMGSCTLCVYSLPDKLAACATQHAVPKMPSTMSC